MFPFDYLKSFLKPTLPRNAVFDAILLTLAEHDIASLTKTGDGSYAFGDIDVKVEWLDDEAYAEIQMSIGYEVGKGACVILRNYVDHRIMLSHELLATTHIMELNIPPDSILLAEYRKSFDALADKIVEAIRKTH